jgi:hypothetical protein
LKFLKRNLMVAAGRYSYSQRQETSKRGFHQNGENPMTTSKIKTLGVALILSAAIASPVFAQGANVRPHHARAYDQANFGGAYNQQLNGDYAPQTSEEMRNLENFGFSGRDPSRVGGENPNLNPASWTVSDRGQDKWRHLSCPSRQTGLFNANSEREANGILNGFHRILRRMDDSVAIHCKRCRGNFRDRARRLLPGYSRQCPSCEVVIFFEDHVNDENVQLALRAARNLRRKLKEAEGVKPAARSRRTYDRTSTWSDAAERRRYTSRGRHVAA